MTPFRKYTLTPSGLPSIMFAVISAPPLSTTTPFGPQSPRIYHSPGSKFLWLALNQPRRWMLSTLSSGSVDEAIALLSGCTRMRSLRLRCPRRDVCAILDALRMTTPIPSLALSSHLPFRESVWWSDTHPLNTLHRRPLHHRAPLVIARHHTFYIGRANPTV